MHTDSGRFLRPLSLSKGRRTAKNSRHFPIRKNGKEAIFYGLSGVPASASIAYGNGYAAPPIPAVLAIANGVFAENSRAGSACPNPCRACNC